MNKRQIVAAMYAARECIACLESGKPLHADKLRLISAAMGETSTLLSNSPRSAFVPPETESQRSWGVVVLKDFLDDCRISLQAKDGARG